MRIVNRKTFLTLPPGTIYANYEPCVFRGLYRKGKSLENDFYYTDIIHQVAGDSSTEVVEVLDDSLKTGCSFRLDATSDMRDGTLDNEALYAIYDLQDISGIIKVLVQFWMTDTSFTDAVRKALKNGEIADPESEV